VIGSVASMARFRELVRRSLGLHLDDTRDDTLFAVIERRAAQRKISAAAYLDLVDGGVSRDEIHSLAMELTIGETYFFRHVEQLRAFAEVALVDRAAQRGDCRGVRILCAGCASGEEAYTLAMLAREAGLDTGPGSIRAVDANPSAIAKAARASYSAWALRETPAESSARWFVTEGAEHVVDASIRAMVRFDLRNLVNESDELGAPGTYDVVFCRNVLMYLTPDHIRFAVERLTTLLAPGGYLFLGHAETLRSISSEYHLRHTHGAFYYQRRDAPARGEIPRAAKIGAASPPRADAWIESIQEASERVKRLADVAAAEPGAEIGSARLPRALELVRAERFGDALEVLGPHGEADPPDVDVLLVRAALLTQNGALAEAERACRSVLALDEAHAGAHYLLALCREAAGDPEGAAEHDRMAAHLDPAFAMPRLHLGMSARRSGAHDVARAELGRALELLQREDPARILLFGGGFARDGLLALCRGELRACGGRS
jgi:chemotaxis protein methyltransferase CheR